MEGGKGRKSDVRCRMSDSKRSRVDGKRLTVDGKRLTVDGRQLTVNSRQTLKVGRLTINRKHLTILAIFSILLVSFVTVAIATGFFGTNTTKISSLEKGLVAHYPLDGVYQTKDVTPYSNHGTNYGATLTTGVKDEPNGAYNFIDGTVTYINCGKSPETAFNINDNFTISYWVYFPRMVGATIVKHGTSGIGGFYDRIESSGLVRLNINHASGRHEIKTGTGEITAGKWYFITMKKEGDYGAIYIDGQNKTANMPKISTMVQTTEDLILGMYSSSDSPFIGKASDVRIYNRALSDDEIQLLYDSYKPKASASDLNKGLVGHWMLDAENGAKDLTPYGNHGIAQGGITIGGAEDRKGKSGGATSFDGSKYITILDNDKLPKGAGERSISVWFKSSNSASDRINILGYGATSTGNMFDLLINYGLLKGHFFGGGYDTSGIPVTFNEWNLAVITYNGTTAKVYYNGELFDEQNFNLNTLNGDLYIGRGKYEAGGVSRMKGSISDVRVYNRALSDDEIQLLFDSYKPKEASIGNLNKGLILDMPLTTKWMKSSTIVSDRTPYGNDGTLMNGVNITNEGAVFDGVNDYVDCGNVNNLTSSFTISAWVNALSFNNPMIVSKGTSSTWFNNNYVLALYPNKVRFKGTFSNSIELDSNTILSANTWYHIVGVYNQELQKANIYINGVKDAKENTNCKNPTIVAENFRIGGFKSNQFFNGTVSNVRIYNRALSDEEVKLLYEKGRW